MKTLLFNPPYKNKIIRRFRCSYNSPGFLFPPLELLNLGGIVRGWKDGEVALIDAIAEGLDLNQCIESIKNLKPDIIISLLGVENFQNDIDILQKIKTAFPVVKMICIGYYPTIFPEEILEKTNLDILLLNEPEMAFSKVYDRIKEGAKFYGINGVTFRDEDVIIVNKNYERIGDLDSLPYPLHSLLKKELYSESRFGGPLTIVQTSRGCPFSCSYCVTTYGHKIFYRSCENVVGEIEAIVRLGIKKIRFIDDTITVKKDRIIKICDMIVKKALNIEWTALSRVDTVDEEILRAMKDAGCRRIYVGVESGSQKILDYYQKGYRADLIKDKVKLISDAGIEAVGFFMVGAPDETEDDIRQSIQLAKNASFDYIVVSTLTPYPGTRLFENIKGDIDFKLFPYRDRFRDKDREDKMLDREKVIYLSFYLRVGYLRRRLWKFLKDPRSFIRDSIAFLRFLLSYGKRETEHKDYL